MRRLVFTLAVGLLTTAPTLAGDYHRHEYGGWGRGGLYMPPTYPDAAYRLRPRVWVPPQQRLPDNVPPAVYPCDMGTGRGLCGPGTVTRRYGGQWYPGPGSSLWTAPGVHIDGQGRDTTIDIHGHNYPGGVTLENRRRW